MWPEQTSYTHYSDSKLKAKDLLWERENNNVVILHNCVIYIFSLSAIMALSRKEIVKMTFTAKADGRMTTQ